MAKLRATIEIVLAANVRADAFAAAFGRGALAITVARDHALTDVAPVDLDAFGFARVSSRRRVAPKDALAIALTSNVDAFARFTGFEDAAVLIRAAGELAESISAALIIVAMRVLGALDALSFGVAAIVTSTIAVTLAEGVRGAALRGATGEIADLVAVGIVADWVRRVVLRVCAIAKARCEHARIGAVIIRRARRATKRAHARIDNAGIGAIVVARAWEE